MRAKLIKDIKYRKKFLINEKKNLIKKFFFVNILNNTSVDIEEKKKYKIFFFIKNYYKNYKIKSVRRCIITGRARGVTKRFGISRMQLREFLQSGALTNFIKSTW